MWGAFLKENSIGNVMGLHWELKMDTLKLDKNIKIQNIPNPHGV